MTENADFMDVTAVFSKYSAEMKLRPMLVVPLCAFIIIATLFLFRATYRSGYDNGRSDIQMRMQAGGYFIKRSHILSLQAARLPPAGAIVLGDSIVELQLIHQVCDLPALNAGISGVTTAQLADVSEEIIHAAKPALVIFAVGINDTAVNLKTPAKRWIVDYRRLLRTAGAARIVVVGIEPIEPGKANSRIFDPALRIIENRLLPGLAREVHATYVAPLPASTGLTQDGVHLGRDGGRSWQAAVEATCSKTL